MGLKFKRFRAKLNWKPKETVNEVVCLRYQIHSEFEDVATPVPLTSSEVATRLRTSDVIKQKKLAPKAPVREVFEESTSTAFDINANNVNHAVTTDKTSANNQNETVPEPAKPKSILKKFNPDENLVAEIPTSTNQISLKPENHNGTTDTDDYKKSALIFMTENHDYTEELNDMSQSKAKIHKNSKEQEIIDLSSDLPSAEQPETEQHDAKAVNWRRTVEYYSESEIEGIKQVSVDKSHLDTFDTETNDIQEDQEFKIHFVKHPINPKTESGTEDSENETEPEGESDTEVDTHYGNRSAYSSQAASIFFAGEEPEPAQRVRNVKLPDDISDTAA